MEWEESTQTFYLAERIEDELSLLAIREDEATVNAKQTPIVLNVETQGPRNTSPVKRELQKRVESVLRLNEDLSAFHRICRKQPQLKKIPKMGAGRIVRGSDLFADMVKGICGTNIAWKQAVKMMHKLASLAPSHPGRPELHSFPTPQEILDAGLGFLIDEVRAGYRAQYIYTLAEETASGALDPQALRVAEGRMDSDELVKAYTRVKGIGKATAHYLLCMAGHYDRLAVDSAVINYCREHYFDGRKPEPREVEALFEPHGSWRALVWWFEFWQAYVDKNPPAS